MITKEELETREVYGNWTPDDKKYKSWEDMVGACMIPMRQWLEPSKQAFRAWTTHSIRNSIMVQAGHYIREEAVAEAAHRLGFKTIESGTGGLRNAYKGNGMKARFIFATKSSIKKLSFECRGGTIITIRGRKVKVYG